MTTSPVSAIFQPELGSSVRAAESDDTADDTVFRRGTPGLFTHTDVAGPAARLTPGPHRTRQRCSGPVSDRPSASRPAPSRQNRLQRVWTRSDGRKQGRSSADGCGEERASDVSRAPDCGAPARTARSTLIARSAAIWRPSPATAELLFLGQRSPQLFSAPRAKEKQAGGRARAAATAQRRRR